MNKRKVNESVSAKALTAPNKANSLGLFLNKHAVHIALALMAVMVVTCTVVFADATSTAADTMWTTIMEEIKKWVTRLGGVAIFVGGVLFGLGWMQSDSREKIAGVSTIIAGGIVIAVAQLAATFFA